MHWRDLHRDLPHNIQEQMFLMLLMDSAYCSITQPRQIGVQEADLAIRNGLLHSLRVNVECDLVIGVP